MALFLWEISNTNRPKHGVAFVLASVARSPNAQTPTRQT
jgi:hypothetical protein